MYGGKGLTLNHPSTHPPSLHPSPTAPVTIATEEEVGIFKGQAACSAGYPRGDYSALRIPIIDDPRGFPFLLLRNAFVTNTELCPAVVHVTMFTVHDDHWCYMMVSVVQSPHLISRLTKGQFTSGLDI